MICFFCVLIAILRWLWVVGCGHDMMMGYGWMGHPSFIRVKLYSLVADMTACFVVNEGHEIDSFAMAKGP